MTTRGIRNNNPGNMEPGGWQGEIGTDGRFAVFDTMVNGIRALGKNLLAYQGKHGVDTVREAIERWAPGSENNTEAYIAFVCHVCELNADDQLNFRDADTLYWLVTAICEEENGHDAFTHGVSQADLEAGVNAALA